MLKTLFRRRLLLTIVLFLVQILLFMVLGMLSAHKLWLSLFLRFLSLLCALWLLSQRIPTAYQNRWLLLLLLFPLTGGLFYWIFSGMGRREWQHRQNESLSLPWSQEKEQKLRESSPSLANLAKYLYAISGAPLYQGSHCEYFSDGEHLLAALLEEVKQAERFLFLEYFIVSEGLLWNSLLPILEEKAKNGVDVRLLYDDCGCLATLPEDFCRQMAAKGIKACRFNPLYPRFSSFLNDRDHRKICIIDGCVGFTGGANLSDEYVNAVERHGHWKDNGILLKGQAVEGLTRLFLQQWQLASAEQETLSPYLSMKQCPDEGFVQLFGSEPFSDSSAAREAFLLLCQQSRERLFLTTPYLIPDRELEDSLCRAARSGVDVRIITPHIPDKGYVHQCTRSFYAALLESGAAIYEYSPGFIHSKMLLSDGCAALIGSINCDYRSLYLNFECGALLYHSPAVGKAQEDFIKTLSLSQAVTRQEIKQCPWYSRVMRHILRLFAPFM